MKDYVDRVYRVTPNSISNSKLKGLNKLMLVNFSKPSPFDVLEKNIRYYYSRFSAINIVNPFPGLLTIFALFYSKIKTKEVICEYIENRRTARFESSHIVLCE